MLLRALRIVGRLVSRAAFLAALSAALGSAPGAAQTGPSAVELPAFGADLAATSVSGLSSGAFMAHQFHIAHSSLVIGVGIVAGGPYGCADAATPVWAKWYGLAATVYWASGRCMETSRWGLGIPTVDTLRDRARSMERAGRIDPLSNLARARIYLFASSNDDVVRSAVVDRARELYESLGAAGSRIASIPHERARHAFLTQDRGAACGQRDASFITDCDYDQAGALLRHIYPDARKQGGPAAKLLAFRQEPFTRGLPAHGLGPAGYVYAAPECGGDGVRCRVHVVFHGCTQAGDAFVRDSGYLAWADGNRLILLFPQVERQPGVNPLGCWDWVGYTGGAYLTRDGPQTAAVKAMLDRLGGPQRG